MPNFATALKAEVSRLARKELKSETLQLKKSVSSLRGELNALKKLVRRLQAEQRQLAKRQSTQQPRSAGTATPPVDKPGVARTRFSPKGLAGNRKRLGLSVAEFGQLVGATGQAVYSWEAGKSRPREKYLPAIAELRGIGKREVARRLETGHSQQ